MVKDATSKGNGLLPITLINRPNGCYRLSTQEQDTSALR